MMVMRCSWATAGPARHNVATAMHRIRFASMPPPRPGRACRERYLARRRQRHAIVPHQHPPGTVAMQQTFDRAAEDLGNAIHLEHVNVTIPDQRLATLFYAAGLGLTRDPY